MSRRNRPPLTPETFAVNEVISVRLTAAPVAIFLALSLSCAAPPEIGPETQLVSPRIRTPAQLIKGYSGITMFMSIMDVEDLLGQPDSREGAEWRYYADDGTERVTLTVSFAGKRKMTRATLEKTISPAYWGD